MPSTAFTRNEQNASPLIDEPLLESGKQQLNEKRPRSPPLLPITVKSVIWQCALFILPSFVSSRLCRPSGRPEKLRPTAYLDGLRGVAAWTVFNAHLSAVVSKGSGAGWGRDETHHEIYKLPYLRLLYNGNFAVSIFFVVSGFALSISFVSSLRQSPGDATAAFHRLASSIFRRPLRLFLPSWVSMLVTFVLIRVHFFTYFQEREEVFSKVVQGWPVLSDWPPRYPSFFLQLRDVTSVAGDMLVVFTDSIHDSFKLPYNSVLWTIKLEFRASLALFLTHAGLYFVAKRSRLAITTALVILGISVSSLDLPLFWTGYLIAETTDFKSLGQAQRRHVVKFGLAWVALATGLFLGSFAAWQPEFTPWCAWLIPLTPFNFVPLDRFWTGVGAALTVASFSELPSLVRLFNADIIQYLGKISFALYLVHFWMVQAYGALVYYNIWRLTGMESTAMAAAGFFVGYGIVFGSTVWIADIFWRCVDQPLVNLAAKWQKRLFNGH